MANHLAHLLERWAEQKDELDWVLATIIETDGSSYRKAGAMMVINSLGQYHGLLSGGCLESDIMLQARRCWDSGNSRVIQYDMREEEDLAWQLGIGCGGLVKILLQPVSAENRYLMLEELHGRLKANLHSVYCQNINENEPQNAILDGNYERHETSIKFEKAPSRLIQVISPPPHIAIFGAGVDVVPVVQIASSLGWRITLLDSRAAYARQHQFVDRITIIRESLSTQQDAPWIKQIDAAVVMNHNIDMDANALLVAQNSTAKIVGLLGPGHRTERVFERANLDRACFNKPLSNPMGLRLGGELPESIALSIIAEIHAYLENTDGKSISGMLV